MTFQWIVPTFEREKNDIRAKKINHLSGFTCVNQSSFERIFLEKNELL
jgi:hypothetical protein